MRVLWIAMTALTVVATGCQTDSVQISRAAGLSPLILPFPPGDENKLKAAVKNFGSERWEGGILRVEGWYNPRVGDTTIDPQHSVFVRHETSVPALDPGQELEVFAETPISSLKVDPSGIPATSCPKLSCSGHLHLTLEAPTGQTFPQPPTQTLPGPNTNVSISWAKSGEASDLVIRDESQPH